MALPSVTIVFLSFNRRDELRRSLREMLGGSDYPADLVDVIVVDNASTDGSAAMVREEFPAVQVLERTENSGVSGFNDGFAAARGEFVLALDDDCYLPGDGLRRAVEAALERAADLVSFSVVSAADPSYRFDEHAYTTGLLTFWGCSVLVRREVLQALGGFDPEIFVWANEVELMMRFFDRRHRHLHLPEVTSVHMKSPPRAAADYYRTPGYLLNSGNIAYAAGRHLHLRDALGALVAMLATMMRNGWLVDDEARVAAPSIVRGFVRGLRRRDPVRPEVSRAYRLYFPDYASPWWWSRPSFALIVGLLINLAYRLWRIVRDPVLGGHPRGRHERYFERRARFYPEQAATLEL